MYSLFTHKGFNESSPFQLTETIKYYINKVEPKIIIVSPGFLSTKKQTTSLLLNSILSKWNSKMSDKYFGITSGMNGVKNSWNAIILQNHWDVLRSKKINILSFSKRIGGCMSHRTNKDHKKMVFFADLVTPGDIFTDIDENNLDTFISKIRVKAVATGSSNFSKTTYLGDYSGFADKGESDIFMYSSEKDGKNKEFHNDLTKRVKSLTEEISNEPWLDEENYNRQNLNEEYINSSDLNNESVFVPPILSRSETVGNIPIKASSKISDSLSDDEKYLTWMLYATLKDQLS